MAKKDKKKEREQRLIQERIADLSRQKAANRGNLLLVVTLIWLIGLVLIVAKYGRIW
ncbi:MAG TPA: hypothetical protein PK836_06685 [Syntrophales bacterium]|nr:hypothetical protein [Syntrophales bacterium]HOM07170.1 hypothetical protein [Syntrophales bacterium]HOO00429.1 hypothetical protein [Syntrophales bacterium]HPC01359.1 hypothetical protein [Syntrophales bacterium]HPQ06751.1 hypothetical protein [Syntrophales bacterium]